MLEEILENLKKYKNIECFEINNVVYTYEELYKYICNIYEYLQINDKEKIPVIVYGHKDIYMIASFLACSFAGIAYVPIDESMPLERRKEIIEQIKPKVVIDKSIDNIMKKEYYKDINEVELKQDDIYYIIFTSGSTGKPKGVQVTYENVQSCIYWLKSICDVGNSIILNQGNFSFDLSVADIYLSLITKSKHYIIDRETQKDYKLLFERLKQSNASLAVMTPSFADLLLIDKSFNKNLMPKLEKIIFCGEKLSCKTVQKLYDRFDNLDIINTYGPTECTFAVTSIHITREDLNKEELSIGIPKKDVKIYIVNDRLEKLDDGVIGEILITGKSVAKGYVDEKLNLDRFIDFCGEKAYLTGDLGYFENGKLYYKCRKDKQIKFKGYRIELSDIEKTLYKLEYIEKVVVTTLKNKEDKVSKIIAFIKLKNSASDAQIKNDISKLLPEYMCPNIKVVEEFPLNQNGKCDEKRLLEIY